MKHVNGLRGLHSFACDHCHHEARSADCETMAFIQARAEGFTVLVTQKVNGPELKLICKTCRPLFGVEVKCEELKG